MQAVVLSPPPLALGLVVEMIVRRTLDEHLDEVIGAFLHLIEADIRSGRHVGSLPDALAKTLLSNLRRANDLDEEIEGDVTL